MMAQALSFSKRNFLQKIQAATSVVEEKLQMNQMKPFSSSGNTPAFAIKKNSGKWRLLQDLRNISEIMKPMGLYNLTCHLHQLFLKIII